MKQNLTFKLLVFNIANKMQRIDNYIEKYGILELD